MFANTKRQVLCSERAFAAEAPSQMHRRMAEEPLGFDANDPNLRRYVGNDPTNAVDPTGLKEASEVRATAGTLGEQYKQAKRDLKGKEKEKVLKAFESQYDTYYAIKLTDADSLAENAGKKYIVKVFKVGTKVYASAEDYVQFAADLNGNDASIVQKVEEVRSLVPKEGKTKDFPQKPYVEGWTVDASGKATGLDVHRVFGIVLDTTKVKSVTIEITFTVGVGLYDGKKITGKTIDNVFDKFTDDPLKPITFKGPKKSYTWKFSVDADGKWVLKDGSIGLSKTGILGKED